MTTQARIWSLLTLAAAPFVAEAQTNQSSAAASPAQPAQSCAEKTITEIKNPLSWLTWGGDFRFREEYFLNALTLNPDNPLHEQNYLLFRARVWASLLPVENFTINARLAVEAREWFKPAGYTPVKFHEGPDYTEGIIDNLNFEWKDILRQPASIIVGRQEILFGDGWLVADGTPFDGSWTYYLDAARLTYDLKDEHTLIDAIGIIQDARDNGWLVPIADETQERFLTEQNEKGAILNVANSSVKAANVTGYFVYKHDNRANFHDYPVDIRPRGGDNADIYTLGGRVTGLLSEGHWKYWIEGAYQFGRKQDIDIHDDATAANPAVANEFRDIDAFGLNDKLTYLFKDKLNNQLTFSYEFLTGDNPHTKNDEMFDVLWGRWPQYSEIALFSYIPEARIGQYANLHRFGPTWSLTPYKGLDFSASYWAMFAQQDVATRGLPGLFTETGDFRGHFVQAILKYKLSKHFSAHLWSEFQFPGDYYVHRQVMEFLRAEVMLTF